VDNGAVKVIHSRPPKGRIGPGKACGFDNCDFQAEAGGHANNGCGIGGNVRLKKCNFDHDFPLLANVLMRRKIWRYCDNSWLDNYRGQCQNRQSLCAKGALSLRCRRATRGNKNVSTAVHADVNRRDFLFIATGAVATVGAALTAWPFISQMNPDASVLAMATIEVDLAPIVEGQEITLKWRGNPVFIRHRTTKEIELAKSVKMEELKDPIARSANVKEGEPATDENRVVGSKENFLVMMGVCTHLGCVPFGNQGDYGVVEGHATSGGWFCPCHGSHYDTAGRIRRGPAPENLFVPKYEYLTDTKILIG
jgi:ubiquinol-cytochrome c reductase iron-sulfur subunit